MLDPALRYAAHGWRVLPLRPRTKVPATKHGLKDATTDPDTIRAWWAETPEANIGIATGAESGIIVVDVDGPEGAESWANLQVDHGIIETLAQRTGREDGGRQYFFAHPGGTVKNRAAMLPGLDVRGDGGYVVVPPSVHPSGAPYQWLNKGDPDPPPMWLVDLLRPPPKAPPARASRPPAIGPTTPYGRTALEGECNDVASTPEGGRNAALNVAAFNIGTLVGGGEIDQPEARAELAAAAAHCGLPDTEARKTIDSGLRAGMASPRTAPESDRGGRGECPPPPTDDDAPPDARAEPPSEDEEPWRRSLLRSKGAKGKPGKPLTTLANAVVYVRNHPDLSGRLAYDERHLRHEWIEAPPWDDAPRPVRDSDAVECTRWLAAREHIGFSRDPIAQAIAAEAEAHRFDPVQDYLNALQWDETPRVDRWLVTYLGTRDEAYTRAVGAAWLISAVARALCPGVQADHMLVLEGEQGIGKSQSLSALGGEWYAEVALDPSDKDSTLTLHGPWIVEWGELAGLTRREAEAVKAFLSRQVDRVRQPYNKYTEDLPRRCVLAATTNEAVYVNDPTGNRRYWPVTVTETCPDRLAVHRDQLWAEAVYRFRAGEKWWLTGEMEEVARERQDDRLLCDVWEPRIKVALATGDLAGRDFVTSADLCDALDVPATAQNPGTDRRIARIMRHIGWVDCRRRYDDGQRRGYQRPSVPAQNGPSGTASGYTQVNLSM